MRILLAHTYYKLPGGEDRVFAAEAALLRRHGHEVVEYCQYNDRTDTMNGPSLAARTIWSSSTYSELRQLLRQQRRGGICAVRHPLESQWRLLLRPAVIQVLATDVAPLSLGRRRPFPG